MTWEGSTGVTVWLPMLKASASIRCRAVWDKNTRTNCDHEVT